MVGHSPVFQFLLQIEVMMSIKTSPRLGKRELVCVLLVHLFVCFSRVNCCHFSLPLGVGGCLRFVIVAFPGIFH